MVAAVMQPQRVRYAPRGEARTLLESRDDEILLEGPVGTGKSFGLIWKSHIAALKHPGAKILWVRKTLISLTTSAVATYTRQVLPTANYGVTYYGGSRAESAAFRYPNGSRIELGGMDRPGKIMSTEYDMICVFEGTELTLDDHESLITRLRNGVMPYQQILLDCNPGPPTHWLNKRCNEGRTKRLRSRHKDNPRLWDEETQDWTPYGRSYVVDKLGKLTGVRRKRLVDGIWAAAEGQVYESWDPAVHIARERYDIPWQWPRYWVVDFGYVHPFVWQAWAVKPDGELVMYREIYMTRRLVSQHARRILEITAGDPPPVAVITDHDAEDRATFEDETGYDTTPAQKNVSAGIQAVANRLGGITVGEGDDAVQLPPRIQFLPDSLDEIDQDLLERGHPISTTEEFASYVWDPKRGVPVKEFDHGMDTTRYLVAEFDLDEFGASQSTQDAIANLMRFHAGMG